MSTEKTDIDEAKFISAYAEVLRDRFATDPEYSYSATHTTPEALASKMVAAVAADARSGGRSDWFAHNPAMKAAGRKIGIARSADLRAIFTGGRS